MSIDLREHLSKKKDVHDRTSSCYCTSVFKQLSFVPTSKSSKWRRSCRLIVFSDEEFIDAAVNIAGCGLAQGVYKFTHNRANQVFSVNHERINA